MEMDTIEMPVSVCYKDDTTKKGTIVAVTLTAAPFTVMWEDGEQDSYQGDQLILNRKK
jgi:hypothetical protein